MKLELQLPGKLSKNNKDSFKKLFALLRRRRNSGDDVLVEAVHNELFANINCLTCANCCKSHPPLIVEKDIERISSHLKMKETDFISKYVILDEDGDFVFNFVPCVFLMSDNSCRIYNVRPKACKEYPHTNRKKIYQIESLTLVNSEICPAVIPILESISKSINL